MVAGTRPHCRKCRKALLWNYTGPKRIDRRRRTPRGGWKERRREHTRLAIRCLYCDGIYCRPCARKHFAPIALAQRAVDKRLAKVATQLLAHLGRLCTGTRRSLRRGHGHAMEA